jgi:hypothetical protein
MSSSVLSVRLSDQDRVLLEAASSQSRTNLSDFVRRKALEAAAVDLLEHGLSLFLRRISEPFRGLGGRAGARDRGSEGSCPPAIDMADVTPPRPLSERRAQPFRLWARLSQCVVPPPRVAQSCVRHFACKCDLCHQHGIDCGLCNPERRSDRTQFLAKADRRNKPDPPSADPCSSARDRQSLSRQRSYARSFSSR